MANELTLLPGKQIAMFCASGPIEFEGRLINIERMAIFCRKNSVKHLIVDLRKQVSKPKTIQMFELGTLVSKVLKGVKIAIVCQPDDHDTKFGENVAANRGAGSYSFASIEEALRWLEGKDVTSNKPFTGDA